MSRGWIPAGDGMPPSDAAHAGDGKDVGVFCVVRMGSGLYVLVLVLASGSLLINAPLSLLRRLV